MREYFRNQQHFQVHTETFGKRLEHNRKLWNIIDFYLPIGKKCALSHAQNENILQYQCACVLFLGNNFATVYRWPWSHHIVFSRLVKAKEAMNLSRES